MKLNKTKVRYILRQHRKHTSTEEIARDLKVSHRRVSQIIKKYKEPGQEPVLGEKIGSPAKAFDEMRRRQSVKLTLVIVWARGC